MEKKKRKLKKRIAFLVKENSLASKFRRASEKCMMNSACTIHIFNNRKFFKKFDTYMFSIQVVNNEEVDVVGIGSILVANPLIGKEDEMKLTDMLYAPNMM